jgi:NADH:ubiquinone oxidoreductase subunit 2 (subunit N)
LLPLLADRRYFGGRDARHRLQAQSCACGGLTLVGLTAAFISIYVAASLAPRQVTSLLLVDRYALFYMGLIVASAAAVAVLSYQYLENYDGHREELYLLLLIATLGCAVLVASSHFVSFLLGLEILSISLYAMVAYVKDRRLALEAGIKYLILASASAAFLLFGMALIYAGAGTMEFSRMPGTLRERVPDWRCWLPGIVLTVYGHRLQAWRGAFPSVDAGCLPGAHRRRWRHSSLQPPRVR